MTLTTDMLLVATALVFGLRHGIDWDHIAAITDITSSQNHPRESLWLGTVYALGHGTVVTLFGLLAVAAGVFLPKWIDGFMERIVGITLVLLGVYVIYSLLKNRQNFRMRSRWMLLFEWAEVGYRWLISRVTGRDIEPVRQHNYVTRSAFLVGIIHGVGAETPTQMLLFITAAGVAGRSLGVLLVLTFIVGLLISNSIITVLSTFGFINARKNMPVLLMLGGLTAVFSLSVGIIFLTGQATILPAILGG